jgi:hypothetical protein
LNNIANTVVETTLFGTGVGTKSLPANFWTVGKSLRLRLHGLLQYSGAGSGGRIRIKLGSTVISLSAVLAFSGTAAAPGTLFEIDVVITCITTGASGTVFAQGRFYNQTAGTFGIIAPTAVVVNTTVGQVVDATYAWTTASASRIVTTTNASIEVIG